MSLFAASPTPTSSLSTRQTEVLDAFERLILAEGFRHLTVGGIAARIGCSRRTLYELAPTKDELVALTVRRYLDGLVSESFATIARHRSPTRQLEAAAELVATRLARLSPAFTGDLAATPRTADLVSLFAQQFADRLADVIAAGIEQGRFRRVHPHLVAEAILGLVDRLLDPAVLDRLGLTYDEAARQITRLFLDGIRSRRSDVTGGRRTTLP
jgi:AcrR family transcriptional regulator